MDTTLPSAPPDGAISPADDGREASLESKDHGGWEGDPSAIRRSCAGAVLSTPVASVSPGTLVPHQERGYGHMRIDPHLKTRRTLPQLGTGVISDKPSRSETEDTMHAMQRGWAKGRC